ncbi:hypothetical protein L195_g063400, partial [Trifolium pratense]
GLCAQAQRGSYSCVLAQPSCAVAQLPDQEINSQVFIMRHAQLSCPMAQFAELETS